MLMPSNVLMFVSTISDFAGFAVIDTDIVFELIFEFSESDPIDDNWDTMGFGSKTLISNLGLLYFAILTTFGTIAIWILLYILGILFQIPAIMA